MKEENSGKKILYGIIVIVIVLVIGIIIVNFNKSKTNEDNSLEINNTVVNEIEEDNPEENPVVKQPEGTERVGLE